MNKTILKGKRRETKLPIPVSPFSTGGGGSRFESLVASYYVLSLLRGDLVQGMNNSILQAVRLQQRNLDSPIDDIVLVGYSGSDECTTAFQVRHQFRFSDNPEFREVIEKCWAQFRKPSFNSRADRIGVVIGEISNTHGIKQDLQDLLEWAKTSSDGQRFYQKISNFKRKKEYYVLFRQQLTLVAKREISKKELWDFLKCFVAISFDFQSVNSMHSIDCQNRLKDYLRTKKIGEIRLFFAFIMEIVGRFAESAGDLTFEILEPEIPNDLRALIPSKPPSLEQSLRRQVTNQLQKHKNSKKYIPAIFVETSSVKDQARIFAHPALFVNRAVEKAHSLNLTNLNRYLRDLGVKSFKEMSTKGISGNCTPFNCDQVCGRLVSSLRDLATRLYSMTQEGKYLIRGEVAKGKLGLFDYLQYRVWFLSGSIRYRVEDIIRELEFARASVLLLISKAGAGKTNFVCDFADRFLIRHGIPALFLVGKDLSGENCNQMFSNMLRRIPGVSPLTRVDEVMEEIEKLCRKKGQPFVIIIDGINEHGGLPRFADDLEHLVELMVCYPFVRVVLTCRGEYFSERFRNLEHASFAGKMSTVRDLHFAMEEKHREWMVKKHLEFFKVRLNGMSHNVKEKLENDPLLLRMFCEAFGDSDKNIPWMSNIYRDKIFRTYLDRKLAAITEKKKSLSNTIVGLQRGPKEVLRTLLSFMIDNKKFNNIPSNIFDEGLYPELDLLLEEEMIIRKDLAQEKSVTDPAAEVLNFVYDEFRDFLIADHLINAISGDRVLFEKQIDELITPNSAAAEGIKRFILFAVKRTKNTSLEKLLRARKWYDTIFISCILELEDEFVTHEDTELIARFFISENQSRRDVFHALVARYDTQTYKNMNIKLLFRLLEQMSTNDFEKFMDSDLGYGHLTSSYHSRDTVADQLISQLKSLLTDQTKWHETYSNLAELVVYLFAVQGRSYLPAVELFKEFRLILPDLAQEILTAHVMSKHQRVSLSVRRLLDASSREVAHPNQ